MRKLYIKFLLVFGIFVQSLFGAVVEFDSSSDFDLFNKSGTQYTYSATGGLNNSGHINIGTVSNDGIWTFKDGISNPTIGETVTISSYVYVNPANHNGYASIGFTTSATNDASTFAEARPSSPHLMLSYHAGGATFMSYTGSALEYPSATWGGINNETWYKVEFALTRNTSNTYRLNVKVVGM